MKWLYLFTFCSFYHDKKKQKNNKNKNKNTEQSGQRIKNLFFILYIWR